MIDDLDDDLSGKLNLFKKGDTFILGIAGRFFYVKWRWLTFVSDAVFCRSSFLASRYNCFRSLSWDVLTSWDSYVVPMAHPRNETRAVSGISAPANLFCWVCRTPWIPPAQPTASVRRAVDGLQHALNGTSR